MKLIVISNPVNLNNEHKLLISLFENGLEYFHLRKPGFTSEELEAYIRQIPSEYKNRIVLHTHHHLVDTYNLKGKHKTSESANIGETGVQQLPADNADERRKYISTSFHSIDEVLVCNYDYEYVFLSPVFDSISKENYKTTFNKNELKSFLNSYTEKIKIVALGGINEDSISQTIDMGFDGVAMIGAIWNNKNPVEEFMSLKKS